MTGDDESRREQRVDGGRVEDLEWLR